MSDGCGCTLVFYWELESSGAAATKYAAVAARSVPSHKTAVHSRLEERVVLVVPNSVPQFAGDPCINDTITPTKQEREQYTRSLARCAVRSCSKDSFFDIPVKGIHFRGEHESFTPFRIVIFFRGFRRMKYQTTQAPHVFVRTHVGGSYMG